MRIHSFGILDGAVVPKLGLHHSRPGNRYGAVELHDLGVRLAARAARASVRVWRVRRRVSRGFVLDTSDSG